MQKRGEPVMAGMYHTEVNFYSERLILNLESRKSPQPATASQ